MTISATSQGLKPGVVTSSNRPANPFDGMMIYETDTDKVLVYDGTNWYQPSNIAWGVMGRAQKTSDTSITTTTTDVSGLSITWTAVSSRLYKISFTCICAVNTANAFLTVGIYDSSNNTKQLSRGTGGSSSAQFGINGFVYESGLSGSVTRKLRSDVNTGTASIYGSATYPFQFIVEDIGAA